ncbi:hypothetical protein ACHHYP_04659, partial [Achlya hypogyna]
MHPHVGVLYLLWTIGCSVWYLQIISVNLDNDLFWPDFAVTGAQTFLIDLFGRPLGATLELYGSVIPKTYGAASTASAMKTTYPRALALAELTSVEDAIVSFQTLEAAYAFSLMTQYCWADFDRRWEVAHTLLRQRRCAANFGANGAVYFEGILRNVDWDAWSAVNSASFMFAVGDAVRASTGGAAWLASLPNAATTVASEVAYWTTKGINCYQLQFSNDVQIGLLESIAIVNVFEQTQVLTMSNVPFTQRGTYWTTFYAMWGFNSDLWAASVLNSSLVRSATNFYGNGNTSIEALVSLYPFTPSSIVIHNLLGPFPSIDLVLVAPPVSLVATVIAFDAAIGGAMQSDDSFARQLTSMQPTTLDPVPRAWRSSTLSYFGGAPYCALAPATTFVQPSFAFNDACMPRQSSTMVLPPIATAFALAMSNDSHSACKLCVHLESSCLALVDHFRSVPKFIVTPDADVETDVTALGVEIVQFAMATSTSSPELLRQSLLGSDWAFFGYIALYDWVYGLREVVSFQGDTATVVLMSERVETTPLTLSGNEIPRTTCLYLWYLVVTTTAMLALVAATLIGLTACRPHDIPQGYIGRFNRIAAPVWVGRPVLLGRGLTAIVTLSTAPIGFKASNSFGVFQAAPRSVLASLVTASESTWISFVISDVLLVATGHYTKWYAPLGSLLAGLATFCIDLASPVAATATLNRSCARNNVDAQLTCTRGTVQIGFSVRAALMLAIQLLSLLVAYLVVRWRLDRRARPPPPPDVPFLIPASVLEFSGAPPDVWAMHPALAVLCGYVHVGSHIFDAKLWMTFQAVGFGPSSHELNPNIVEIPTHRLHH